MIGLNERDTNQGVHVVELDYIADPVKRSPEWEAKARQGVPDRDWRREYMRDWTIASGTGIYSNDFSRESHVAKEPLSPVRGVPIGRGYDYGLQPACVWGQLLPSGVMFVLRELVTWTGQGTQVTHDATWLAESVATISQREYPGFAFEDFDDPAGAQRAQTDSKSARQCLQEAGIYASSGPMTFQARRDIMGRVLKTLRQGSPALLIDNRCRMLIEGFDGAYKYKQVGEDSRAVLVEQADKNAHSHIMNALEYLVGSVFAGLVPAATTDTGFDEDNDAIEDGSPNRSAIYY